MKAGSGPSHTCGGDEQLASVLRCEDSGRQGTGVGIHGTIAVQSDVGSISQRILQAPAFHRKLDAQTLP